MRNPVEFVRDLYDYQYQQFRWYIHRRVLFSGVGQDKQGGENVFQPKFFKYSDREDSEKLIAAGAIIGSAFGLFGAGAKYLLTPGIVGTPIKKFRGSALFFISSGAALGAMYGAAVSSVARIRDVENGPSNHAWAAALVFPLTGLYAKSSRGQWAFANAVFGAAFVATLKYINIEKIENKTFNILGIDSGVRPVKDAYYRGEGDFRYKSRQIGFMPTSYKE